jgi:hypothetical protein
MDRMIRADCITGLKEAVPLSGVETDAAEELDDCEECKSKASAPGRRNSKKPMKAQPGDVAADIQQHPCPQVGTAANYGTLFVALFFSFSVYISHGTHKDGFEMAMDKFRVTAKHLQGVDVRAAGRFVTGIPDQKGEYIDFEDGAGNVFNHLITDYDAAIKAAAVTAKLRKQDIDSSYSSPHAHH